MKPKIKNNRWLTSLRNVHNSSPQKWFVMVALVFGILFTFLVPPFQVPDELAHMGRAYQVSEGRLWAQKVGNTTGGYVAGGIGEFGLRANKDFNPTKVPSYFSIPLQADKKQFVGFPNIAPYSPLVYVPQAAGMFVGRIINLPAAAVFYLGRLANVAAYALLFYWAIRLMPFGKWAMVVIGLLPMHILLAGSFSADSTTIGILALFVAAVLYCRTMAKQLKPKQFWLLAGLVAVVALTKIPTPLVLVLLLFIPANVLGGDRKKWWQALGILAAIAAIIGIGWLLIAKTTMTPYGPIDVPVDPNAQTHFVLKHPLSFLKAMMATLLGTSSDGFLRQYVVSVGPVAAWMPLWVSYAYTIFLALTLTSIRATKGTLIRLQKYIVLGLLAMIVVVISLLLYISWNSVGNKIVEGFQARYFTPLLLLFIPMLAVSAKKSKEGLLPIWIYRYLPIAFLTGGVFTAIYYFAQLKISIPFVV